MSKRSEILTELKELLENYNESIEALMHHEKAPRMRHLLNELHAKIIHLEELHRKAAETEFEKKKRFLQHHQEAVKHAMEHLHTLQDLRASISNTEEAEEELELELAEEIRDMEFCEHRMHHLLEEIKREDEELHERLHVDPMHPHPFPHSHNDDDENHN
ncbi:MAG TPA: hypothetical protein VI844_02600 [Coxiellaceae bacterium]|nr:hypothetical protein [Coxiellaceae bacterium]